MFIYITENGQFKHLCVCVCVTLFELIILIDTQSSQSSVGVRCGGKILEV